MWVDVISAILALDSFDYSIGNMKYVFINMIAKFVSSADYYRFSDGVLNQIIMKDPLLLELVRNDQPVNMKKYFYGKNKISLLEHMVPTSVISKHLLNLGQKPSKSDIETILSSAGDVTIMLRSEDALLSKSKMPQGWKIGDTPTARYDVAGVKISKSIVVRRDKNIYR